jgi:hypothetical protein
MMMWDPSSGGAKEHANEILFPTSGADGVLRSLLTRIHPTFDAHGTVTHWFVAAREQIFGALDSFAAVSDI